MSSSVGTSTYFSPFEDSPSIIAKYSNSDQLKQKEYKQIIESETNQSFYDRQFLTLEHAVKGPLNSNVPKTNRTKEISINGNKANVLTDFWHYKQPAGTIFTNWESAGISALKEDMSVRNLKIPGTNTTNPNLVLSNANYVRNNLTNYGKEYLTTTNLLNSMALENMSYESSNTSPYRSGKMGDIERIIHGGFKNKADGDLYQRTQYALRVDLPVNYQQNISAWQYINPAYIVPNKRLKVFHDQLKFGLFNLESIPETGAPCLTKNFSVIPNGLNSPVDVMNDDINYPPVSNPDYYKRGSEHLKYPGSNDNMYCSRNTNYVVMPKNYAPGFEHLDASLNVSPGNNSVNMGVVMPDALRKFIITDLYNFNKNMLIAHIYVQEGRNNSDKTSLQQMIENQFPHIKQIISQYASLSEENKYAWIYDQQLQFVTKYSHVSDRKTTEIVEHFIKELSIFKFGGLNENAPSEKGRVVIHDLNLNGYPIEDFGCFLLLPTMLSQDLFTVGDPINGAWVNPKVANSIHNNPNSCIVPGNTPVQNAENCCYRGHANQWQQVPNPTFIPNMFNDPNNQENGTTNLVNPYCGVNPYNAPNTF